MGRMKEIYMEMIEQDYQGDHDAFIQEMARQTCEEFIEIDDTLCPNCSSHNMERNETEARCLDCGQEFVYVEGEILRFK